MSEQINEPVENEASGQDIAYNLPIIGRAIDRARKIRQTFRRLGEEALAAFGIDQQ